MSEHDLEAGERKQEQHDELVHRDAGKPDRFRPNYVKAGQQIEEILAGHGDVTQLPQLVSFLDKESRKPYVKDPGRFAAVPGDIGLQCATELGVDSMAALKLAFRASTKPTPMGVRRYLEPALGDPDQLPRLATIDAAMVHQLRGVLTGDLATELPSLVHNALEWFEKSAAMLHWFVETTPPAVAATTFGMHMTAAMAVTLDKEKLWSWVDAARPTDIQEPLAQIIPTIGDGHARTRLESLASGRAGMERTQFVADREQHAKDLHAALAGAPTLDQLYAAAARGGAGDGDLPKLIAELTRLHASADDVLSFASLSTLSPPPMFHLLLRSPGVTAQHIAAFLHRADVAFLGEAKVAAGARAVAPTLDIQTLFEGRAELQEVVLKTPALFAWFVDTAQPKDLFWLCTVNLANAARAIRLVHAKVGLAWVQQLPAQQHNDDTQMRVLLLNVHDEATASYIREHLLGEVVFTDKTEVRGSRPSDPATQDGAEQRFDDALGDYGTPDQVIARLRDLDPAARAKLAKQDDVVTNIATAVGSGDMFARAARLLDLSFASTVGHSPERASTIAAYLSTRPHSEQLATLEKPELVERATKFVHENLLIVFPALTDPKVLAAALGRDAKLLELLLEGSDSSRVASLLGTDPARKAAAPILHANPSLVAKLARYKDLSAAGRHGVDELEAATPDGSREHKKLEHERSGELDNDQPTGAQGHRMAEARVAKTLVEAIDTLGGQHERKSSVIDHDPNHPKRPAHVAEDHVAETNALAILEEHKAEVPALLTDRTLRPSVDKLVASIDLPPDLAIPWISAAELARMPNAVTWWMHYRDPELLLRHLDNNKPARVLIAGALSSGTMHALDWVKRLPKGFELDSVEAQALDQIRPLVSEPTALQALFLVRFGVPPPTDYTVRRMNDLWTVIGRLPSNQITQEHIRLIQQVEMHGGTAGIYSVADRRVDINSTVEMNNGQKDSFYPESYEGWYTRDALKVAFGYDDALVEQLKSQGRLDTKEVGGEMQFRLHEDKFDMFTQVVLHEVGHSIDDILGSRTPPVWDYAGWHEYSDGTFDQWAAEMGGWEHVNAPDKKEIREAWIEAARGDMTVQSIVGPDHPAVAKKYEKVGIVKAAREGKKFAHTDRVQIGDRVFVAGSSFNSWYSLKASAAQSAPSVYSLNAPAEYFAESYVEYYRGVDGSPGSQTKKGGALPGPVRTWFDENVDKLKYDPRRFKGGATERKNADAQQPAGGGDQPAKKPKQAGA